MYGRWRFTMPTGQFAELVEASQATADDERRALTPAAACWMVRQLGLGGGRRGAVRDTSLEALGSLAEAGSFWVARRPDDGAYRDLEAAIRARHVLVLDARAPVPYVPLLEDPEEAPANWSSPPPSEEDDVALVAFADFEDLLDLDCSAGDEGADVDHGAEVDEEQPFEHDHDAEDEATEIEAGADADAPAAEPEPNDDATDSAPAPHDDQPAMGAASA